MNKADEAIRYALACRAPLTSKMIFSANVPESIKSADAKYDELREVKNDYKKEVRNASEKIGKLKINDRIINMLKDDMSMLCMVALGEVDPHGWIYDQMNIDLSHIYSDKWGGSCKYKKAVAALQFADEMLGSPREAMILTLKPDSEITNAILHMDELEEMARKYIDGHEQRISNIQREYDGVISILKSVYVKPVSAQQKQETDYNPMHVSMQSDEVDFWGWIKKKLS